MDTGEFFNSQLFAGVMALAGTVLGAFISARISVSIQREAAEQARQAREEERRDVQIAAVKQLQVKFIRLVNNLTTLRSYLRNGYALCTQAGDPPEAAWKHVRSFANLPDRASITAEEISLLGLLKNDVITNAAMLLDARHNAHIDSLRTYTDLRRELTKLHPLAVVSNDNQLFGAQLVTAEQKLQANNLGRMLQEISNSIEQDVDDAVMVLSGTTVGFEKLFGEVFMKVSVRPSASQAAKANASSATASASV